MLIYLGDGAVLVMDEDSYQDNWRDILVNPGFIGRFSKAIFLGIQPIINPLGVFGLKTILVAKQSWLALLMAVEGLFSVTLVALFILAIRRRFRME